MRRSRFAFLSFAAAAACAPAPARAQCRLCATPTTTVQQDPTVQDVQLEIETALNFDRLITLGQGEGFAELRPNGAKSGTGTVTEIGPRAMVGTVVVRGQSGRAVRVDLPARIELFALGGGRMTLDQLETDLPSMPRLDSAGNLTFRFGGRLRVTGDAEGDYRGDLPITVEYLGS